jgi:hypothetical protein
MIRLPTVLRKFDTVSERIGELMRSEAYTDGLGRIQYVPELLSLLGCPHRDVKNPLKLVITQVSPEHAAVVTDALFETVSLVANNLEYPVCDASSLLAGLHGVDCWERCLLDEDHTHYLAALIFSYLDEYVAGYPLDKHVKPIVLDILNKWLALEPSLDELPDKIDLAETLFGTAWCMMRLSDEQGMLGHLVNAEKPPFLPGICPCATETPSMSLPGEIGLYP